jgi:pimeloyl-ACP methyl ester carboxylesterase
MSFLDDIRDPSTVLGKIFLTTLFFVTLLFLALVIVTGFTVYGILSPKRPAAALAPENVLGNPEEMNYTVPGVGVRTGWFFPGPTTAPTVILCHNYRSYRGELLTLVTALTAHRYNVFIFDFLGHGANKGMTTLGYREAKELEAVVDALARRKDVDRTRFGVWGAGLGGYAAIVAASTEKRIRAVAVDSVYNEPEQMLRMEVDRTGLDFLPLYSRLARWGYWGLNYKHRKELTLAARLPALAGVHKLFIQGRDTPVLANATLQLFTAAPEPREQAVYPRAGYVSMLDDEKRSYEEQLVTFFLGSIPPFAMPGPVVTAPRR